MPTEPVHSGGLAALLASLEPALAAEQARSEEQLSYADAPVERLPDGDYVEVLALDGTVLFANVAGVSPGGGPEPLCLWLHYGHEAAERALDAARGGEAASFQAALATEDGVLRYWDVSATPLCTATGVVDALLVTSRPVQKRDDAVAVRDTMERLDLALNAGPVIGTWVWDVPNDRVMADSRLARAFSVPLAEAAAGLPLGVFTAGIHEDDRAWVGALIAETTQTGGEFSAEYRLVERDGRVRWVQASGRCEMDAAGQPLRFPGVLVDVHDRKELERATQVKAERQTALLALGDRLRDAPDAAAVAALAAEWLGRMLGASHVGYAEFDPQAGQMVVRHDWTDGVSDSVAGVYDATAFGAAVAQLQRGLPIVEEDLWSAAWLGPAELQRCKQAGLRALVTLPLLREGHLVGSIFVGSRDRRIWTGDEVRFIRDIADRTWSAIKRVQVEEALRASAAELRMIADTMPVMITQIDQALTFRFVNRASADWFGLPPEQIVGQSVSKLFGAEAFARRQPFMEAALAGRAVQWEAEWPQRDGTSRMAEIRYLPRRDAWGGRAGFYAFVLDITNHKRAEQRLLGSANALEAEVARRTADRDRMWLLSADIMLVAGFDGRIEAVNPAWGVLLGWDEDVLLGADFFGLVHPEDQAGTRAALERLLAGERIQPLENRLLHQDGSYRWVSWSTVPDGRSLHAAGRDITAERERERLQRELEEQLHQSQKMEAVGHLTGGLAHDFNNLLTGIIASLELLQVRLAGGQTGDLNRYIEAAQGSAHRAAALTHRLLAFSRRQTLDPKPTEVNQLIESMAALINGTVGPAVEVMMQLGEGVWSTLCDANQLENVLLNLCINARDAMASGGRLVIETANATLDDGTALDNDLPPGDYVMLSVGDTGTGMAPDVAARAFDPFFTTKPQGEGTGLGLSMIYGFVKQSGGQIRIFTELGRGTTMLLFLPRHHAAPVAEAAAPEAAVARTGRGESILLVDDEASIRDLAEEVLLELGYDVVAVEDGAAALAVLRSGRPIDLLVTDVGLPGGLNGRELADTARADNPALKVLFITGYAANAVIGNGVFSRGMHVLTKPFTVSALAIKIRSVLAGQ